MPDIHLCQTCLQTILKTNLKIPTIRALRLSQKNRIKESTVWYAPCRFLVKKKGATQWHLFRGKICCLWKKNLKRLSPFSYLSSDNVKSALQ